MNSTSVLVVNDYLGGDVGVVSDVTKRSTYKRLHFDVLHGPTEWKRIVQDAGFRLLEYETLDRHMKRGYRDMAKVARQLNLVSKDGSPLALNYEETANAIDRKEIGMNLALYELA